MVLNDPRGLTAISVLPAEFDRDSAGTAWTAAAIPESAHEELWATFEAGGLFAPADDGHGTWWEKSGWREARAYHEATRDYPFLQMDRREAFAADAARMRAYADEDPAPPVYQRLGGEPAVQLPRLRIGHSAQNGVAAVARGASGGRERIGVLLDVCFGERGRIAVADGSTCILKNIPSGGARHPTEVFLAVFDIPELPPGIYHYDVESHRLDTVRAGQHRRAFADATLDLFLKFDTPPGAALVFTSLVERAMWRYRDPRSFRAVLVDIGHAVSAYRHVAELLGFRTYAYQKMDDERIADLLQLDRFSQPPLYVGTLVP